MFKSRTTSLVHLVIALVIPCILILSIYVNSWILYLNYVISCSDIAQIVYMANKYRSAVKDLLRSFIIPLSLFYLVINWRALPSVAMRLSYRMGSQSYRLYRKSILGAKVLYWEELVKECESVPASKDQRPT